MTPVWVKGENKKNFIKDKPLILVDLCNNIKCKLIYKINWIKNCYWRKLTHIFIIQYSLWACISKSALPYDYTLYACIYELYIGVFVQVLLEDLTADKLPSHAFITTIDQLSITNCTFGTIERNAFPVNTIGNVTLTNVTVDRIEGEAFQHSSFITNLRMTGCRVREMETNAVMSAVQSIYIEQSQ